MDFTVQNAAANALTSSMPSKKHLQLLDLPQDVLASILDYIMSPSHLSKCTITCRAIWELAMPRLYKSIEISIVPTHTNSGFFSPTGGTNSHRWAALTRRSHSGLQFLKALAFTVFPGALHTRAVTALLVGILRALPKGQLEQFAWAAHGSMPANTATLLWQRHPSARPIFIMSGQDNVPALVPQQAKAAPTRIQDVVGRLPALYARPEDATALVAVSRALQLLEPDALCLDAVFYRGPKARLDVETGAIHDHPTTTMFKHLGPATSIQAKWPGLRMLWLFGVDFKYCRQTWFTYLELAQLETLHIYLGDNADIFLMELIHQGAPRLRRFALCYQMSQTHSDRTVTAVDDLLVATKHRLERLAVVLRSVPSNEYLDLHIINSHRSTLKELLLDLRSDHGMLHLPEADQYLKLLHGCFALTQLGLSLPVADTVYTDLQFPQTISTFTASLFAIFQSVHVRTLSLVIDPYESARTPLTAAHNHYAGRPTSDSLATSASQLERLATHIFAASSSASADPACLRRKLELVSFGTDQSQELGLPVLLFFEAKFPCLHREYRRACPVLLHEATIEGLETEILGHRSVKMHKEDWARRDDYRFPEWDDDDANGLGGSDAKDGEMTESVAGQDF